MTVRYQIRDVASRSGFSPATLRYYEEIGLVRPAARTPAGYRLYDDAAVERLAFIARAKQLGCSLDEIADLTRAWEGGKCGPIQDRLRRLVTDKLATAREQIVDLVTLTEQLQQAAAMLEQHRPDGPCDDRCGCVTDAVAAPTVITRAVTLSTKLVAATSLDAPIACTLASGAMPRRLDDWQSLLAYAARRESIDGGLRVTFDASVPIAHLAQLVADEHACCSFFRFSITVDDRGVALEARAAPDALPIVHALLGAPK